MNEKQVKHGVDYDDAVTKSTPKKPTNLLMRSKVKEYALDVAKRKRPANGFRRVSASFYIACEAALDARIRAIQLETMNGEDEQQLVTGYAAKMAKARLNRAAAAIIIGKVMKHPSVGVTLSE